MPDPVSHGRTGLQDLQDFALCSFVATARQRALACAQPRILATSSPRLSDHFHTVISRGSAAELDQLHYQTRVGMTVAISRPIRSIAVIGRKRSAQDSWDDACASTSFGRWSTYLKRRLAIDLIFNPKEKTMLKNFLQDETGAELAEYAVAVALLVAIAVIVYNLLGKAINESNSGTGET